MVVSLCTYQLTHKGIPKDKHKPSYKPLNIGRIMLFDRNQKIYGLVIESTVGKGIMRRLSEIAESLNIVTRYIQFSMEELNKQTVNAIVFLDFSNSRTSPEEALELVRRQPFVISAQIIKPHGNAMVSDNYFFPLIVANERAVIFRKSVYSSLFKGIREKFGSAGEAMLYYQGFTIGFEIYQEYKEIAGSQKLEDLIEVAKAINMTLGWGIADKIRVDVKRGMAKLRIYDSFECENGKNHGKPYSQFYRGAIAGIFAHFFGKEVKVQEVKCIAKSDPYCEFIVKIQI